MCFLQTWTQILPFKHTLKKKRKDFFISIYLILCVKYGVHCKIIIIVIFILAFSLYGVFTLILLSFVSYLPIPTFPISIHFSLFYHLFFYSLIHIPFLTQLSYCPYLKDQ